MKKENLLFADINNLAYVPPRDLNGNLDNINTGNAYYDYYDKLIDRSNTVIVPLMMLQIDKKWMHLSRTMDVYPWHIQMCC